MIYNTSVDLVNDIVYTKFVYILSIHSQDIEEQKLNYDRITYDRITEGQTGQIQYIPHFFKAGL